MAEFILFIAIFVGIMAISALIFGGLFLVMIVRGVAGFLGLRSSQPAHQLGQAPQGRYGRRASGAVQLPPLNPQTMRTCPYELCESPNELGARFCRRCGRELGPVDHVHGRRTGPYPYAHRV